MSASKIRYLPCPVCLLDAMRSFSDNQLSNELALSSARMLRANASTRGKSCGLVLWDRQAAQPQLLFCSTSQSRAAPNRLLSTSPVTGKRVSACGGARYTTRSFTRSLARSPAHERSSIHDRKHNKENRSEKKALRTRTSVNVPCLAAPLALARMCACGELCTRDQSTAS